MLSVAWVPTESAPLFEESSVKDCKTIFGKVTTPLSG